jgi:lipid-binding SYLF domain-containing protein
VRSPAEGKEPPVASRLACFAVVVLALAAAACTKQIPPASEAESVVERARTTVEAFKKRRNQPGPAFRANLRDARGVLIFPDVFKAAAGVGGQGGTGVLLVRNEAGAWSYPAFYTLGGGSLGLQLGASSAQMVFVLRNEDAVRSVIDNQFEAGGDLQWTFGSQGAGYTAATTTNVGADVVGFAIADGVFAGVSAQAGSIARRPDLNHAFYAREVGPRRIVLANEVFNLHADPLRRALAGE